jgi:hypothetical protein
VCDEAVSFSHMMARKLCVQPGQASCRARPPGMNPPAIKQRRLKTGWNGARLDQQPPGTFSSPLQGAPLVSPADLGNSQ